MFDRVRPISSSELDVLPCAARPQKLIPRHSSSSWKGIHRANIVPYTHAMPLSRLSSVQFRDKIIAATTGNGSNTKADDLVSTQRTKNAPDSTANFQFKCWLSNVHSKSNVRTVNI